MNFKLVFLLGLILIFQSCATVPKSRTININTGMTKQQVLSIMGNPGDRQFKNNKEAWQYFHLGMITDDYTIVWFTDGFVTGLTSYTISGTTNFSGIFKTIQWEDAPDFVIEKRYR